MRTTLNLSADLHRDLRILAAQERTTVTALVDEGLRSLLAERAHGANKPSRHGVMAYGSGGLLPGVDLANNAALDDIMEGRA